MLLVEGSIGLRFDASDLLGILTMRFSLCLVSWGVLIAMPLPAAEPVALKLPEPKPRASLTDSDVGFGCGVFSPNGKMFATGSWDGTIRIWDIEKTKLAHVIKGHKAPVRGLAFLFDGKQVISVSEDRTIKFWNLATNKQDGDTIEFGLEVYALALSNDGKWFIAGGGDWRKQVKGEARLFDTATRKAIKTYRGYKATPFGFSFSADGKTIAIADGTGPMTLWEHEKPDGFTTINPKTNSRSMSFAAGGKMLINGNEDGTLQLWDTTYRVEEAKVSAHQSWIFGLCESSDGKLLATAGMDSTIKLWSLAELEDLPPVTLHGHKGNVWFARFSPDGKTLVSGGDDKVLRVWDVTRQMRKYLEGSPKQKYSQAPIPSGKTTRLAIVARESTDTTLAILDLAEVDLAEDKRLQLLDRKSIDRILAEQKLSLSGLVDANTAVKIGKLLAVEMFAVVETSGKEKEVVGFAIYDAATGIKYADRSLPEKGLRQQVKEVLETTRNAVEKRARGRKDLRTICLMGVRNAELSRDRDTTCRSLAMLLERQLISSANVTLLERKRLEFLNKEKSLPSEGTTHDLLSSLMVLDLEFGRAKAGHGLRATATISDGVGKTLQRLTVEGKDSSGADIVEPLFQGLSKFLQVAAAPRPVNRRRESARFFREAELALSHNDWSAGIQALEASFALNHTDEEIRARLAGAMSESAFNMLKPQFTLSPDRRTTLYRVPNEDLKTYFALKTRAINIYIGALDQLKDKSAQNLNNIANTFQNVFWFSHYRSLLHVAPQDLDAAAIDLRAEFEAHFSQVMQKELALWEPAIRKDPAQIAGYTAVVMRDARYLEAAYEPHGAALMVPISRHYLALSQLKGIDLNSMVSGLQSTLPRRPEFLEFHRELKKSPHPAPPGLRLLCGDDGGRRGEEIRAGRLCSTLPGIQTRRSKRYCECRKQRQTSRENTDSAIVLFHARRGDSLREIRLGRAKTAGTIRTMRIHAQSQAHDSRHIERRRIRLGGVFGK